MEINDFRKQIMPLTGRLFHYAYLLLKNKTEAEDAVQEVFLKLWKIRESLDQYNSIEAFSLKVTRNWCLDRIKARKPVYIESYNTWYDRKSDDTDPYKTLENTDELSLLFEILDKLPEQQRHIIQLRELENREFEEIAEIMDMNVNAVRVNLSRARNRIREEMTKFEYK
ncbi:MAG TPA: sigma-70 family RNA polymerase sigma factor [Bacteroidales bacterium]|nr:sigma-70 family RNA polymerase sigma factor [Bacteroidales bacterium]